MVSRVEEGCRAWGRSSKQVGWSLLRDGYLASLSKGAKHDYHAATITRHLEPFFGRVMDVRAINASKISDYLVYRNTSTVRPPLPQTLNRENIVLRQLLKFASTKGWIGAPPQVPNQSDRLTKRRRRHFTETEYTLLRQTAVRRIRGNQRQVSLKFQGQVLGAAKAPL